MLPQELSCATMDYSHLMPNSLNGSVKDPPSSRDFQSRPATPAMGPVIADPDRKPRKLVLCFDGTGNKFHGDDSDSNILKIFRMLDRQASDQYHYYQRKPSLGALFLTNRIQLVLAPMSSLDRSHIAVFELGSALGTRKPKTRQLAPRSISMS